MRSSSVPMLVLFVVTILVCFGHSPAAADPPMKMRKPDAAGGGFNGGRQRGASDAPWLINDLTGLLEARESPKFWLGITRTPAAPALRSQLSLLDGQGLVVLEVGSGTPAWRAGILKHDVLVSANGQMLKTVDDLVHAVDDINGDGSVKISLIRKAKPLEVTVIPAKWIGVGLRPVNKAIEFLESARHAANGKTHVHVQELEHPTPAIQEVRRIEHNLTRRLEAMEGRLEELRKEVQALRDQMSREPDRARNRRGRDI